MNFVGEHKGKLSIIRAFLSILLLKVIWSVEFHNGMLKGFPPLQKNNRIIMSSIIRSSCNVWPKSSASVQSFLYHSFPKTSFRALTGRNLRRFKPPYSYLYNRRIHIAMNSDICSEEEKQKLETDEFQKKESEQNNFSILADNNGIKDETNAMENIGVSKNCILLNGSLKRINTIPKVPGVYSQLTKSDDSKWQMFDWLNRQISTNENNTINYFDIHRTWLLSQNDSSIGINENNSNDLNFDLSVYLSMETSKANATQMTSVSNNFNSTQSKSYITILEESYTTMGSKNEDLKLQITDYATNMDTGNNQRSDEGNIPTLRGEAQAITLTLLCNRGHIWKAVQGSPVSKFCPQCRKQQEKETQTSQKSKSVTEVHADVEKVSGNGKRRGKGTAKVNVSSTMSRKLKRRRLPIGKLERKDTSDTYTKAYKYETENFNSNSSTLTRRQLNSKALYTNGTEDIDNIEANQNLKFPSLPRKYDQKPKKSIEEDEANPLHSKPDKMQKRKDDYEVRFGAIKAIAKDKGGKCLSSEYKGVKKKLLFECAEGHHFDLTPDELLRNRIWVAAENLKSKDLSISPQGMSLPSSFAARGGSWCKICRKQSRRNGLTIEKLQQTAKEVGGPNAECLSEQYLGNKVKHEWKCEVGHRFWLEPFEVRRKTPSRRRWCPHCKKNKQNTRN